MDDRVAEGKDGNPAVSLLEEDEIQLNRPALKFGTRSLGLFLSLIIGLSHPAFALRSETTEGAGLEEQLAKALQGETPRFPVASSPAVPTSGLEENDLKSEVKRRLFALEEAGWRGTTGQHTWAWRLQRLRSAFEAVPTHLFQERRVEIQALINKIEEGFRSQREPREFFQDREILKLLYPIFKGTRSIQTTIVTDVIGGGYWSAVKPVSEGAQPQLPYPFQLRVLELLKDVGFGRGRIEPKRFLPLNFLPGFEGTTFMLVRPQEGRLGVISEVAILSPMFVNPTDPSSNQKDALYQEIERMVDLVSYPLIERYGPYALWTVSRGNWGFNLPAHLQDKFSGYLFLPGIAFPEEWLPEVLEILRSLIPQQRIVRDPLALPQFDLDDILPDLAGLEEPGSGGEDALVPISQEIQRGPLNPEEIFGRIDRIVANLLEGFLAQPPTNDDAIRLFIQAFIQGELSVGNVLSGPIATYHLKPEVQEAISTLALSALANRMQANFDDPNPWRRRRTIELLGRLTDEFEPTAELIEALRGALFDEDEEVRVITAWSLGMVASPTIGRPQGMDWPPEVFLSLLGTLVRHGSRTGTSTSMTLERYFFQHGLNVEGVFQSAVRMNREGILNEPEISALQQTLTGQAHDPGRLDEDPLQEMLRRTLAPHESRAVRQLLADAFLEVAVSHRLLRSDHVLQLQALVSSTAEPEIRQFAEGAIRLIVQSGLEESIPLTPGVTAKKMIFITPEMASPQLFESLRTFKPAPGVQLPLVVFAEHDFHVEEIQRWLNETGLKALEIINVKRQIEEHKDWNLFDVVAAKQAEYYMGTGADIHTIWFFEDLKNLGRFLGVAPIHIQLWEKFLERQFGTQA